MPRIIDVIPHDDYTLTIELNNHHKVVYDMKTRIQSSRFCELADINKFKALRVEYGKTLVWDGLCQITIDEILSNLER